jgi:phage antirepressor YoqD-like protein
MAAEAAENAPKVEFYDRFAEAGGREGLQVVAKILHQPHPNLWIKGLVEDGYLFRKRGNLVPYARHVEAGLFEVRVWVVDDVERCQAFVTPKGIQHFAERLRATAVIGTPGGARPGRALTH